MRERQFKTGGSPPPLAGSAAALQPVFLVLLRSCPVSLTSSAVHTRLVYLRQRGRGCGHIAYLPAPLPLPLPPPPPLGATYRPLLVGKHSVFNPSLDKSHKDNINHSRGHPERPKSRHLSPPAAQGRQTLQTGTVLLFASMHHSTGQLAAARSTPPSSSGPCCHHSCCPSPRLEHILHHSPRHAVCSLVQRPHLPIAAQGAAAVGSRENRQVRQTENHGSRRGSRASSNGRYLSAQHRRPANMPAASRQHHTGTPPAPHLSRQPRAPRLSLACCRSLAPGMGTAPCRHTDANISSSQFTGSQTRCE
jgi:hypothetical protein